MLSAELERDLIETIRWAAKAAILPRFRHLAPSEISTKSGPSDLVTLADTEAEAMMTRAISDLWPQAVVLGEEAVAADPANRARMAQAEWAVILDPVDGTWNFAKGLSTFGVILAVCHKGLPVFSVLYDPVMDDWIAASPGKGAHMMTPLGHRRLTTSPELRPRTMNGYVPMGLFGQDLRKRIAVDIPDFGRLSSLRCACHEYRMVAQGHSEFALSGPTPHPWDHAAGVLAVQEAGGVARFLDGAPYDTGRLKGVLLVAGSQDLWDILAERFAYLS